MTASLSSSPVFEEATPETRHLPSRTLGLLDHVRALYRFRELLWIWAGREIKVRYKQSVLGAAWAVLQPLVLMIVFTVVFSYIARVPTGGVPYPIFSYTALLPWTFLATSISFAAPSLVTNMNLVTKVYFPREILPIGSLIAAFVDFLVASVVFLALMLFYRIPLRWTMGWIPVLLLVQIVLTLGVILLLSALCVRFRDIRFVVPLGVQIWMYASPIIYPSSLVPERFRAAYALNPMVGLIDAYRAAILTGEAPDAWPLAVSAAVALTLLLAGFAYFKRSEATFADII